MPTASLQDRLIDWLLGTEPRTRRYARFVALTGYFFVVCAAVALHAQYLGLVQHPDGWVMAVSTLGVWAVLFALVRTGWSARCADPTLTLPHCVAVIGLDTQAYVLSGPARSNVLLLLALTVVIAMFRLTPRQIVGLNVYAGVMLAGAMVYVGAQGGALAMQVQELHIVLTWTCLAAMSMIAREVSQLRLRQVSQREALAQALEQAHNLATRDVLTGLVNRMSMEDTLDELLVQAHDSGEPLSLVVLDIDFFKLVNDSFGHRVGDVVLQRFARVVESTLADTVGARPARWGGEEFLLALPGVAAQQAVALAERLRARVAAVPWADVADGLQVSFSAGVAQYEPGEHAERWIERADAAMYAAKHAGRDACVLATADRATAATCSVAAGPPPIVPAGQMADVS